ncbi:hypothetical protein K1719_016794 [Acacia pycnantha]|nr:hypothetical protein K1719_016794 [Acacia pycnantha]
MTFKIVKSAGASVENKREEINKEGERVVGSTWQLSLVRQSVKEEEEVLGVSPSVLYQTQGSRGAEHKVILSLNCCFSFTLIKFFFRGCLRGYDPVQGDQETCLCNTKLRYLLWP